MSKFNDGFDAFCLRQETKSLESALKNEVGLVQGGRQRRKSNYKKHDDEVEWPEESCHPEEDPSTRLIKMECKIPTRKKKERNSKGKPKKKIPNVIRNETRRVLTGFCFQNGLSFYFPLKLDEESSSFTNFSSWTKYFPRRTKTRGKKLLKKRQNRLLTRRLRGGTGGRGQHPPISPPHERRLAGAEPGGGGHHPPISTPHERRPAGAGTGRGGQHPPISPPHERRLALAEKGEGGHYTPISTPHERRPAGAGTGGGGQHPPISTPNESHPAGAGTGEGQHPPISTPNERHPAGPGTEIELVIYPSHFEKTISSIFNSPTSTHGETLKTADSSQQIPEEDHHDHDGGAHKKSPMSPGIRHYTMAGKMKTHRLSLDSFHQAVKKRRESASPSPSSTLTLSSSTSSLKPDRRVKMRLESDDHDHSFSDRHSIRRRPEKTSLTPSMELRSRKSLATRRDSASFSVASRFKSKGHLISRVSQIRETSGDFERDTEWLQWTSSEDDDQLDEHMDSAQQQPVDHFSMVINSDGNHENANHKPQLKIKQKKKTKTIQPELKPFINSIKGLEKLGFWMGLNPYQKVVRGNGSVQVKWVPKSWRFAAVGLNAFFFLALTLSASNTLIYIYSIQEPLPVSLAILKVDFANHFAETLFLLFISLFLLIHCVSSMLEQGYHFAEFMGRFNTVVSLTRYDVSEGIYEMIKRQLSVAVIVSVFCTFIFFSRAKYADFREGSGFLGLTILYPLNLEIRESIYYPFVEIFGLLVFLYCFIGVNVVVLQFLVYAKGLANMAKIFNRRLIYALGDTSIQSNQIRKHIPFDKLRAEHQMIVSLVRHLSHVSILYIYSFMMSIVLELALGIYLLFDMFLSTEYHSNVEGPFISERGTIELAVPIRETTLQEEWIVYSFAMIGITWLTYWLFGDVVHKAGEYLNAAGDYVRRHGLISCGSSKERRFILSIMNSCASRDGHWIGRNFNFNRLFLVSLVSVVIGCSMVTISYRPDRLNLDSYEICNADGVCTHIRASKLVESQAYQFYRPPQLPLPQYPSPSYNKTLPPFNESVSAEYFAPDIFIDYPPCSSFGSYPNTESDVSVVCPASWEGNRNLTEIKLPLVYKYMLVKFPSVSAEFNFHGVIRDLFYSMENGTSKCRTRDFPFYNFPYTDAFGVPPSTPPTDCFGSVVDVKIKDDCGNFPFSTINAKTGKKVEAKLKPVYVPNLSGLDSVEESLVCCYEYGGFAGSEAQAGVCNVANAPTFEVVCETGLGRRRLQPAHIKEDYRKLLARLRYLNIYHAGMGSSLEYIRKNEETIRGCLCKLDEPEISLNSEEHCACVGLQLPPCLPGYVTGKDEDYTHSCGAVKVPLLFKMNSDFTLVFPGEHERYKDVCVGDKFNDRFSHNDTLSYDYPCALPVPHPPDPIRLMDCAGKPILKVEKDDCSNWNVRTPDLTNQGQMLRTLLRLKVVNYNLAKKEFVSTEEKNRAFVCCFEYQGQAFQSPHQVKYCNVPSVETMNNDGWCGAVARNNGIRNSAPFDIKLHTQLHRKLELTVRYHEVKGRPDWILEKNEVLKRCMCTNMIAGANQASYLDWVRKCIPLIVPPVDADKANVFRSIIHKCPHKWSSSYPQKEIKTPLIFTIENDIWESHDRFRKTLDSSVTSKCHLNEEYEEVYKNDGNPIIYDGNLNSLPLGETDDCWNIPQRTFVSATGTSLVSPQVRLSPEYTMARYDANAFKESTSVHCCYSFSNFPSEQRLICSLPNAASVKKHCNSKPKSERRLEHEYQLTRRLAVFENGANYIGDQVINSDYSLTLDSPLEKIWRKCICEANSSSDSTHNMCRKEYLPPCVKSKGQLGSITKFEKMFTQCSAQWTGITYTINLPIIMEFFENGSFAQIPLFEEGGVPKQCPTNNTNVVTLRSKLSDCYGEEIEYGIDDCNLPSVHTPNRNEFWQRMESTKELIGVNHLPGLETSEDFFCCNKYGISLIYDVIVCNQPNPDAITRNCKFERDPFLTRYADKLRNRRGRGFDPLTLDTAFINPTRAAWTKCLCYGLSNECENATNRQLHPCLIAQHSSEMGLAEFSKCRTNKSTPWEDLQPSYNSYPIILQNIDDTDYRQVMLLGQGRCLSVDGSPPFPPDTIYQLSPNSHLPIVDCRERPIPTFFGDDCGTPIIELPPGSKRGLIIRVSAELFREFKVAKCVVEYQFGNQAEYFNMPSHEDYNRKCKGGPANFYNFFDIYNRIKSKVERTRMETDSKVVHCLCYHLEYLRRKHFGSPASEQECRAYFETFCQKPGSC